MSHVPPGSSAAPRAAASQVGSLRTMSTPGRYVRRLVSSKTFRPDGSVSTTRGLDVGAPRLQRRRSTGRLGVSDPRRRPGRRRPSGHAGGTRRGPEGNGVVRLRPLRRSPGSLRARPSPTRMPCECRPHSCSPTIRGELLPALAALCQSEVRSALATGWSASGAPAFATGRISWTAPCSATNLARHGSDVRTRRAGGPIGATKSLREPASDSPLARR